LRAYIREIDQQGLLEPVQIDPVLTPPVGTVTERWLQGVQVQSLQTSSSTGVASDDSPPSFDSLNTPTSDATAKEMVVREDNMKFPPSMKLQRPKPESRAESLQKELDIPRSIQRASSPVLAPVGLDEKEPYYLNTDGSSEEDSEADDSSRRSISPSYGQIISTTSLMAMSQALTVHSQSPSSFRSQSSFIDDGVPRSIASRPRKQLEYGTSPLQPGAIPISIPNSNNLGNNLGNNSRPFASALAPDSQGNEIPADAKWTKISRRLVSPEVLAQDKRRYEA
jgi:hypothetical protein